MAETVVRQQIFSILSAVPNIGRVYDYERWATDWISFINLFKDPASGRILGWEISRMAVQTTTIDNAEDEVQHRYLIRGYMGMKDADRTEILFNGLIEQVRNSFRRNFNLNGTCEQLSPLIVPIIELRIFGSVLCHYCEMHLTAQEIL